MQLQRKMLIYFSIHIFKEGLTNVWVPRNEHWHLIREYFSQGEYFFPLLFCFFFFHHWIRLLEKSSRSVSTCQGSTALCFVSANFLAAWCCYFKVEKLLCDLALYQLWFPLCFGIFCYSGSVHCTLKVATSLFIGAVQIKNLCWCASRWFQPGYC